MTSPAVTPPVHLGWRGQLQPKPLAGELDGLQQRHIGFVQPKGRAGRLAQAPHGQHMIEMSMGCQQEADRPVALRGGGENHGGAVGRIDDHSLARRGITEDVAVGLHQSQGQAHNLNRHLASDARQVTRQ
jgi:hypothetical protein